MTERHAAAVWKELRGHGYNAIARFVARGQLAGEHVVEIEPGHDLHIADFRLLIGIAEARDIDVSYGTVSRRVVVLS